MNEVIDFFTSNTTLAYLTALVIFIITIVLVVRRLIGFMITLLLLFFALVSGLAIANYDLFREILVSFKYDSSKSNEDQYSHFKASLNKAYDELKTEYQDQKQKIEDMYEAYKATHKEEKKAPETNEKK